MYACGACCCSCFYFSIKDPLYWELGGRNNNELTLGAATGVHNGPKAGTNNPTLAPVLTASVTSACPIICTAVDWAPTNGSGALPRRQQRYPGPTSAPTKRPRPRLGTNLTLFLINASFQNVFAGCLMSRFYVWLSINLLYRIIWN